MNDISFQPSPDFSVSGIPNTYRSTRKVHWVAKIDFSEMGRINAWSSAGIPANLTFISAYVILLSSLIVRWSVESLKEPPLLTQCDTQGVPEIRCANEIELGEDRVERLGDRNGGAQRIDGVARQIECPRVV